MHPALSVDGKTAIASAFSMIEPGIPESDASMISSSTRLDSVWITAVTSSERTAEYRSMSLS